MNASLEHIHGLLGNKLHITGLEGENDFDPEDIEQFVIDAAWLFPLHTI